MAIRDNFIDHLYVHPDYQQRGIGKALLDLAHQTDVGKVKTLLDAIVAGKEKIDQDPGPQLVFVGFGETALKLRFSVWTATSSAADLKTELLAEIKQALQQEGIAFPNAQRTLIVCAPVEVRVVAAAAEGPVSTPQVRPETG